MNNMTNQTPPLPRAFGGVVPSLCLKAELGPPRSECGVGALMPWADRLWAISYVSSLRNSGIGTGLYEIDENLQMTKRPESRTGVYTNRYIHTASNQLIIGPHVIDAKRNVRTIDALDMRITATMEHLADPKNMVYMLGMEGEFYEMNVHTLECRKLYDLVKELELPYVHFKAGYTCHGRVVVADNSYDNEEFEGRRNAGVLAEWNGETWKIIERSPFVEVTGRGVATPIFATGWDRASALLYVYTSGNDRWTRYRLPKASHTFDHMWSTEWPRIRETEHERFLMDHHGMFYELPSWTYGNRIMGLRPISTHLAVLGDFCSYRGMLVMGYDNASPAHEANRFQGEPQSGMWFGKLDDLWQFGKPAGWGGPWWKTPVKADEPSDPFLMLGFDKKCLHISHDAATNVLFTIEVDFLGDGSWHSYGPKILVGSDGYSHFEFPDGFSAQWVRLKASRDCTATAQFYYT
ncbi:MAG: hypothetical protein ACOYD3_09945 [Kiritimatiellia bacterium]|jgi:hypothetical protein